VGRQSIDIEPGGVVEGDGQLLGHDGAGGDTFVVMMDMKQSRITTLHAGGQLWLNMRVGVQGFDQLRHIVVPPWSLPRENLALLDARLSRAQHASRYILEERGSVRKWDGEHLPILLERVGRALHGQLDDFRHALKETQSQ
jgi:hypothetical protein